MFAPMTLAALILSALPGLSVLPLLAGQGTGDAACDAVVVDDASVLSSSELDAVEDAATSLRTDTAFEVRVRVLTVADASSLDRWADDMQASCSSWGADEGGFRTNLVVLAFTTDEAGEGESALYYGEQMPEEMDEAWPDVLADEINPHLASGEWDDGVIAGLDAVRDVVDPPTSPWVWAGIGVPVAGVAAWGGRAGWQRRTRRRDLGARLERAAASVDERTLRIDPLGQSMRRDVELVRTAFHPDELATVIGSAETTLAEADQLVVRRSELATDRDQLLDGRDLDAAATGVGRWDELDDDLGRVLPAVSAEQERLAAALALGTTIPARLGEVDSRADEIRQGADEARADGFVVTGDIAVLDTVAERREEIERLVAERRLQKADESVTALLADLDRARELVTSVRQRRAVLAEAAGQAQQAQDALAAGADGARAAEQTLITEFGTDLPAEESTAAVAARTAEAGDLLAKAGQDLASGDLDASAAHLDEATSAQQKASAAQEALVAKLARLSDLRENLPARRARALDRLGELRTLISRYTVTLPGQRRVAAEAIGARLDAADLDTVPVDWLAAGDAVEAAERELNAEFDAVQEARQAADRRNRAASYASSSDDSDEEYDEGGGWGWLSGSSSSSRRRSWGSSRSSGSSWSSRSRRSSSSRSSSRSRRSGGSSRRGGSSGRRRGGSSRR